jgi:hypothetical protein
MEQRRIRGQGLGELLVPLVDIRPELDGSVIPHPGCTVKKMDVEGLG